MDIEEEEMKDIDISLSFIVACLLVIILILMIIMSSLDKIVTNECKNSPVEQFRNSEYCEVIKND
jgi:hypothetical protein